MSTLRKRVIEAGRKATFGQWANEPDINTEYDDVADPAALAGARVVLEDLEAVYVAWLRLEEADEKGHWQTVQVALNGVRSRLADLSPSPAVCNCGSDRVESARYGHAHLAWCPAASPAVEPIARSQNEQAWEDLRADGGLPEAQFVQTAPPVTSDPPFPSAADFENATDSSTFRHEQPHRHWLLMEAARLRRAYDALVKEKHGD